MLQLACGLESEIAGETEILGQIKEAWRDHERDDAEAATTLRPWMQRLLQDTKEIRSEYVVGLGSATYGSLVRRLLGAEQHGPTLLLGAGQLADTVLPYLDADEVWLWNRHARPRPGPAWRGNVVQVPGNASSCSMPRWRRKSTHGSGPTMWSSAFRPIRCATQSRATAWRQPRQERSPDAPGP